MTNEEILKAAQNNRNEIGEYETDITRKSIIYGTVIGVALCIIMTLIEAIVLKKVDFGKPTLVFVIAGYIDLFLGVKNKINKRKFLGIIELVVAVLCLSVYIGALFV